jgi:hypothetical protein
MLSGTTFYVSVEARNNSVTFTRPANHLKLEEMPRGFLRNLDEKVFATVSKGFK